MLPQTELDNYKLQVELLQEKLKRSEEHRQQLEEKFENLIKIRNEDERKLGNKRKFKYQQFIEKLKERNERNKELVKMLERVDQEAAVLAAKSERLKMMKIQYELYFAKLLKAQAARSVQMTPKLYAALLTTPQNLSAPSQPPPATAPSFQSSVIYPTSNDNLYRRNYNMDRNSTASIMENCNVMMANSFANANIDKSLSHQIPTSLIHLSGQIPLNQVPLESTLQSSSVSETRQPPIRQVNLKSNTEEDSIYLQSSNHSNIGINDTKVNDDGGGRDERARNDFKFYLNPKDFYVTSSSAATTANPMNIQKLFPNKNEPNRQQIDDTHNIGRKNEENRNERNNNYFEQNDKHFGIPTSQHYLASGSDIRENTAQNIDEYCGDNEYGNLRNSFEKSEPINIVKQTYRSDIEMDDPRQKINVNAEEKMKLTRNENIPEDDIKIFPPENWMMSRDGNKMAENYRMSSMWDDGNIDRQYDVKRNFSDSPSPIKLGKKEKISIESIENVIYGEKISPIRSDKSDSILVNKDKFVLHDNENFENKNKFKFDSHQELIDTDETNTKEITVKKENELNTEITDNNLSTSQLTGTQKTVRSSEEKEIKVDNNQDRELIYTSEVPVNQQHPENMNENYQRQPINEDNEIRIDGLLNENQINQKHELIRSEENKEAVESEETKAIEENVPKENQYTDQQYTDQNYQYQNETDYQNQAYTENYEGQDQNYQNDPYQYDPNTYQYNYDEQQQDGQYADQYISDGQYNTSGQYSADGQYPTEGQYASDGQYTADGQYPVDEQYPTEAQYSTEGQYPSDGQYATEDQYPIGSEYNADNNYQEQVQQNYSEDQKDQQIYGELLNTEYQPEFVTDVTGNLENNDQFSQQEGLANIDPASSAKINEQPITPEKRPEEIISENVMENRNSVQKNESQSSADEKPATNMTPVKPILSTDKSNEQQMLGKKKKRVNFLDSESEDSSSIHQKADSVSRKSDESDFDFSSK